MWNMWGFCKMLEFDSYLSRDGHMHFQTQSQVPGVKCIFWSKKYEQGKVTAQVRLSCEALTDGGIQQCTELPCFAVGNLKIRQGGTQEVIWKQNKTKKCFRKSYSLDFLLISCTNIFASALLDSPIGFWTGILFFFTSVTHCLILPRSFATAIFKSVLLLPDPLSGTALVTLRKSLQAPHNSSEFTTQLGSWPWLSRGQASQRHLST